MARQFKRDFNVTFLNPTTGVSVSSYDLRVQFEVTKDLFGYPNLAQIAIFNLSRDRVTQISEEFTEVSIVAGYENTAEFLFIGEIRNIVSRRDGIDTITEIFAGDGDQVSKDTFFSKTFAPGTDVKQIVLEIANGFGIPKAKLDGLAEKGSSLNGFSFSGRAKDLLDKLSDTYNFYWSVQDGQFTTQDRDGADTDNEVIRITRSTGMIGSPAVTELGADVRTLLNPKLQPYRVIQIETPDVDIQVNNLFFRRKLPTLGTGLFRVNKVVHTGDTRGNNWTSSITGRRL